ncbi:hypothetical protein N0V83_009292 [Neocucurbitaria cava]|uniref:Protein kinase domain-containing protein n=1 Tax=Neocucurbitaria cava TaxID=798079 RepID=A0A9W9CIU3_9PLEO|nr:hypothetical protein N0V83_009292 [Neocucurbitaria cava]
MAARVDSAGDRIYSLEVPVTEDQIWSDPRLDKAKFFAALYHLQGPKNGWSRQDIANQDLDYHAKLQAWFDSNGSDEHFDYISNFWQDRTHYYARHSRRLWPCIEGAKNEIANYFQSSSKDFDQVRFDKDWGAMKALAGYINNSWEKQSHLKSWERSFYIKFYNFWSRQPESPHQDYPRPIPREGCDNKEEAKVKNFCKCLKYMEMLGMPWSIWRSMQGFIDLKEDNAVQILLVKTSIQDKDRPSSIGIHSALEKWRDDSQTPVDVAKALTKSKNQFLWDGTTDYFHCELQLYLLSYHIDKGESMHKFIGCSKLSCQMCWQILQNAEYRTRASHHQVSPNCAFPFPRPKDESTRNFEKLLELFQKIQLDLITYVRDHGDGKFSSWRPLFNTEPAQDIDYHLKMVEREIGILRGLKHSNILTLVEEFFDEQRPHMIHLVTQPWAPITLKHVLEEAQGNDKSDRKPWWYNPGSLEPWPIIVKECLEGLEYLHTEGNGRIRIKHKDLKPENILLHEVQDVNGPLDRAGAKFRIRPIIADFGLSKPFVSDGGTDNLGTYAFKSPQQRNNTKDSLLESDIWSLGCCFAFILVALHSGQQGLKKLWKAVANTDKHGPFDEAQELLRKIFQETRSHSDRADMIVFLEDFRRLVFHMLQFEPSNRPKATDALAQVKEIEAHLLVVEVESKVMTLERIDTK